MQDANREREFRAIVEQRLADAQLGAAAELEALREETAAMVRRHSTLTREHDALSMERDQLLQRLGTKRVELDSVTSQRDMLQHESQAQQQRIQRLEKEASDVADQYDSLSKEHINYRVEMQRKLDQVAGESSDKLQGEQRRRSDGILQLEQKHREELAALKQLHERKRDDYEAQAAGMADSSRKVFEERLRAQSEEVALLQTRLSASDKQRQEERMEADALRLRHKAQEQQLHLLQQDLKQLRGSAYLVQTQASNRPSSVQFSTGEFNLTDMSLEPPSPIQSEDMNASSWPGSPVPVPVPVPHRLTMAAPPPRMSATPRASVLLEEQEQAAPRTSDTMADSILAENKKLKLHIREV
jgi:chromosome segregation ATPase